MRDYVDYAVTLRRQLHEYPEIGYDLPKTLRLVKCELDRLGIPYTEEFGPSSIVATINPSCEGFTIGLRGDMDALPIEEKTGLPFSSKHPGIMHACGHDVHTANLLMVGRWLKEHEEQLRCRVKLLFTPAEEYISPGSKQMAENGVTDDIDCILACHVDSTKDIGKIGILEGAINANSMGITIDLYGRSSHAVYPHKGVDAIAMAVQVYQGMLQLKAKGVDPREQCVVHIGSIHGGSTNNSVCDHVQLFCTLRTHSDAMTELLLTRVREIANGAAAMNGGQAHVEVNKLLPYVYNESAMYRQFKSSAEKVVGAENIMCDRRGMGGEDFGFFSRRKPCLFFRLGTCSGPETSFASHTDLFDVDERCFQISLAVFTQFILDNQDGIENLPKTVKVD